MATCTQCGHRSGTPAQACPACGAATAAPPRSQPGRPAWPAPPRRAHGGRVLILGTAAAVLAAAGGGTALALARFGRPHAATGARTSQRPLTTPARASAGSGQPAATPSAGPSPVTQVGSSLVAVRPALAGRPGTASLVTFLTGYFTAINQHDYLAYRRLFSPQSQLALTRARFMAGYASSADSAAALDAFSAPAPGQLVVTVSFTSRQRPGAGPAGGTCTDWRITLYLTRQGTSYVIGAPPAGYRAAFRSCP